jgi:site-specific DNA recombinase
VLKAVGYARISKDDTLEGRGVARQTEDIVAVCERHGWDLVEVLTDNDISASRYSKKARPGYERLVEMIRAGAVDRAVVYDVDRLLRQPRQLEDLIDLCEERNGAFQLHNVNGELDLVTSSGRFIARVLVGKAAMESDDLSRRLRRAFDQKAAEGQPHGARGFGYDPDGMTVREAEADLIRRAAVDVLDGASLNEIARRWNVAGTRTPQSGRLWSGTVVKLVLTNPRQAGLRVHRRGTPDEATYPAAWPAIIDRATHDRLVAHFKMSRHRTPPRRTAFTGLIRSAETGLPLDRDVVRGRPTYRAHNRPDRAAGNVTISAEPLERLIVEMLCEAVESGDLAPRVADQRHRQQAAPDLAAIEVDLRGLAEDFGEGRITRAEWMVARGPLENRLKAAQAAVEAAETNSVVQGLSFDLRARWPELDVDRQRAILAAVFEAVLVHPGVGGHETFEGGQCERCATRPGRRGGPAPMVEGIGRIDLDRVDVRWKA